MERREGELHAIQSCPHIEALITYRVTKEAEQAKKRNEKRILLEQQDAERVALQAAQLEMVKEQIEERKAAKKTKAAKADPA
jgi:glucose dehydrogenase